MRKQNIVFFCSRLDTPGGIERAIVNTANLFQSKGHHVTLIILDDTADCFYKINSEVAITVSPLHFGISIKANKIAKKFDFLKDIKSLRRILKHTNADVIISTDYVFTIAAYFAVGKKIKIFCWEHHHFYWLKRNRFWQVLFNFVYPKISLVICLNYTEAQFFKKLGCKTAVIPNHIPAKPLPRATFGFNVILSIGWIIKRKGVDLIPAIAEKIFQKHPLWKWRIIGDGEEKASLEKEIALKNLSKNIEIVKPTSPYIESEYLQADIYVMPSRFECFPMVLLEAMSYGLPVVAFNCPTGPADIVQHNEDGLLIEPENAEQMTAAILQLIWDEEKRKSLGQNAAANIQRYNADAVYDLWKKILFNQNVP